MIPQILILHWLPILGIGQASLTTNFSSVNPDCCLTCFLSRCDALRLMFCGPPTNSSQSLQAASLEPGLKEFHWLSQQDPKQFIVIYIYKIYIYIYKFYYTGLTPTLSHQWEGPYADFTLQHQRCGTSHIAKTRLWIEICELPDQATGLYSPQLLEQFFFN